MRSAFKPVNPVENLKAARREIAQDEFPARFQHPQHFLEYPHRALQMVKGVHTDHGVETGVGPGQMFGIVDDKSNPVAGPRPADVQLRRALLLRVCVQRRDAFCVLRHRCEEAAFAGADFEHMPGQRQAFAIMNLRLAVES